MQNGKKKYEGLLVIQLLLLQSKWETCNINTPYDHRQQEQQTTTAGTIAFATATSTAIDHGRMINNV
jgi:hypothetical protein